MTTERAHTIEEIRDVWLRNRNADGTDWEQALGAVYDLGAKWKSNRIRRELLAAAVFVEDGPGEGLVTVPGEEKTGQSMIPVETLDRVCPAQETTSPSTTSS